MIGQLQLTKVQALLAGALIVVFAVVGLWFGAPPDSLAAGASFADVLRAFAREQQTRTILAAILVDVVTGVIAALRTNQFSGERVGDFMHTNVLPFILGYMLFWFVTYFGLIDLLPIGAVDGIASLGYGAAMASITVSIIDNLARAQAGTTPPHDAIATDLKPFEPLG